MMMIITVGIEKMGTNKIFIFQNWVVAHLRATSSVPEKFGCSGYAGLGNQVALTFQIGVCHPHASLGADLSRSMATTFVLTTACNDASSPHLKLSKADET